MIATGALLPVLVVLSWPALRELDAVPPPSAEDLDLLERVPFLASLPHPALEHLAGALRPVSATRGEAVIREGQPGDRFYVVAEGHVTVTAGGRQVFEGGPGYYFGEIALLRDEPRMATVTATVDTSLLALERDEFLGAVTGHSDSSAAADAVVASRLWASRPGLLEL